MNNTDSVARRFAAPQEHEDSADWPRWVGVTTFQQAVAQEHMAPASRSRAGRTEELQRAARDLLATHEDWV